MSSRPCKWGRKCHRVDCYFFHPEGREIDEQYMYYRYNGGGGQGGYDMPQQNYGAPNIDPNYISENQMQQDFFNITAQEEEMAKKDEWYPASRNCNCCNGYIYGCKDQTCNSLGVCGCQYGKTPGYDENNNVITDIDNISSNNNNNNDLNENSNSNINENQNEVPK
eukprot:TRINITY_DN24052_c1_g1_i1.p1 TRINITY_DN24052_c1_g1~~TRINITY_DN24052_c1_g1_i1.p1  ORF type:complete len:166 (+),score=23.65 TRINITY_DN24052_c1_g1_i1:60-557(+)